MANSGYYTEPKLNANSSGTSLTVREADGTPSGVVSTLVFPNGSVSIASSVATITLVGDADPRLGVIYDTADGGPALSCLDADWTFASLDHANKLKLALGLSTVATSGAFTDLSGRPTTLSGYGITDAASSTHAHGNITNAGAIGSTADLIVVTGASGGLTTANGSTARGLIGAQETLVSGTNIRTVNGNSLLGSGDLAISGLGAIASQTILGNNTGGSATPTGLTASQVRALLGLATTDSPTFAGLTLGASGVLVGGTNRIEQRNGTNAQILEIAKTWQSSTNFEELTLDASSDAANYRIGSRIGSSGGTTRGLQLGAYNAAGAWTSWLGIDTSGNAILAGFADVAGSVFANATNAIRLANRIWLTSPSSGVLTITDQNFSTLSRINLGGATSAFPAIKRNGTTAEIRLGDDSSFAPLSCSNLTASGSQITLSGLPTTNPGVAGRLWNDAGTLKIS